MKIKILSLALTALLLAACDNNKTPETARDAETTSPAAATDMTIQPLLHWTGRENIKGSCRVATARALKPSLS